MSKTERDAHLNVRLSTDELRKLHEIAEAEDLNVSIVIRRFIRERHAERCASPRGRRRARRGGSKR